MPTAWFTWLLDQVPPKRRWLFLGIVALVALGMWLFGCSSGSTSTTLPNGTKVKVQQSPNSVAPAWLKMKWLGPSLWTTNQTQPSESLEVETSTGNDQPHNLVAEAQSRTLTWVGIALIVAGAAGWIAKAWVPVIPVSACIVAASLGVGLLTLPHLFQHTTFLYGAAGVLVLLMYVGWSNNKTLLKATPPASPDGQSQ